MRQSTSPEARDQRIAVLQLGLGVVLASYPWLRLFGPPTLAVDWDVWLVGLGLHALWLTLAPNRARLLWLPSLVSLLGLCLIQSFYVYDRIVNVLLHRDYMILASELYTAARDINGAAPNVAAMRDIPISYLQNYFDPVVPLLNRVFDLTADPFRLLGFQTLALFSAPFIAWFICQADRRLYAFRMLLPTALVAHPSVITTARADYHTSAIGFGCLLAGSYLFFNRRRPAAFALLLIGTLTKVSFWPSWIMFGVLEASRRQWRWAALYVGLGLVAVVGYQQLGHFRGGAGDVFFHPLGDDPATVLYNLVFRSELWRDALLQRDRWEFFGQLTLPLGFAAALYPPALLPTLPLAGFTFLDVTGYRSLVNNTYAVEYLGFLAAGSLVGLTRVRRSVQAIVVVSITVGLLVSLDPQDWQSRLPIPQRTQDYLREAAFNSCALAAGPALATGPSWSSYARGALDRIWFVEPRTATDPSWRTFALLVYPINPAEIGSLVDFAHVDVQGAARGQPFGPAAPPWISESLDVPQYTALFARLPVRVDVGRFRYDGDAHLAGCALQYGYTAVSTGGVLGAKSVR